MLYSTSEELKAELKHLHTTAKLLQDLLNTLQSQKRLTAQQQQQQQQSGAGALMVLALSK